jgi:hypothetical protein
MKIEFKKEVREVRENYFPSYYTTIDNVEVDYSRSSSYAIAFENYCGIIEENIFRPIKNGTILKIEI